MAENISPHHGGNDGVVLGVRWSIKDFWSWWFCGESKGSEGIHDKINPKHLNSVHWRVRKEDRSEEDNKHGDYINGKLEL